MKYGGLLLCLAAFGCASAESGSGKDQDLSGAAGFDLATPSGGGEFDLATPDLAAPLDFMMPLKDASDSCTNDAECASGMCKAPIPGLGSICVISCSTQTDCSALVNFFCEATTPGSPTGLCIPRSPMHCASCNSDADCGILAERCFQAPGDTMPACHIDCALAGAAACPSDYTCSTVSEDPDGGAPNGTVCVPKLGICNDSQGGFCDRTLAPQQCWRTNQAGNCNGQRTCIGLTSRYDKCDAMAPQYKQSCTTQDPAGCVLKLDPSVTQTVDNCGTCGNKCSANQGCCAGNCTDITTTANCGTCGNACGGTQACCSGQCVALNTIANCNTCGNACAGGQTCCASGCATLGTAGNCSSCGDKCGTGSDCCGGTCTPLNTVQHCGACGTSCSGGQACCNGQCVALNTTQNCGTCGKSCNAGEGCCNGTCTPLGTQANCAGCGNLCGTGALCCGGICTQVGTNSNCSGCGNMCGAGSSCCGGTCTPLGTNANCNGCGNVCGVGASCCGGSCTPLGTQSNCSMCGDACSGGSGCCGGACTPLNTVQHCGTCGTSCAPGSACCGGTCTPLGTQANCSACGDACGAGSACCGGVCTPLGTQTNCAGCGNLCGIGSACCGGTCTTLGTFSHCASCGDACTPGQDCCGGACTQLGTTSNCASCGNSCGGGQDCCSGSCQDLNTIQHCNACGISCGANQICCGNGCQNNLTDVDNCGTCGNVCPGMSATTDDVGCVNGGCTMTCKGENYDVNQNPADGCEVADNPQGNHDSSHTIYLGSFDCYDSSSNWNPSGLIPSDLRVHTNPGVLGFDSSNGDAPDWFSIYGSGGTFCQDDVHVNLQVYGSANPGCYHLTVYTNNGTYQCQTNSSGACSVAQGSGSYGDNSTLWFEFYKTCGGPEDVSYSFNGHL